MSLLKEGERIGSGETSYNREDAERLRSSLIELRDGALEAAAFDWAVSLSHSIAFMAVAIAAIWGNRKEGESK